MREGVKTQFDWKGRGVRTPEDPESKDTADEQENVFEASLEGAGGPKKFWRCEIYFNMLLATLNVYDILSYFLLLSRGIRPLSSPSNGYPRYNETIYSGIA